MAKAYLKVIGGVLAVVLLLAGIWGFKLYMMISAGFQLPPEAVTTVNATKETWRPSLDAMGSLAPVEGTTLAAQDPGKVVAINFESGSEVKKGDLLVQLDVAVEKAQLASSVSKADLATIKLDRYKKLTKAGAISAETVDTYTAEQAQALAEADQYRAMIDRRTIRAPFTGRTGIRSVQLGEYLAAGTKVVPLQTLDPIYIDFTVPQQKLSEIKEGQEVEITLDSFHDRVFKGKVTTINPQVEETTRNIKIRATLDNKDEALRPGMFARVNVISDKSNEYVTLPITAIARAPYGDSVYIVEKSDEETAKSKDKKDVLVVRQVFVTTGATRGDQISILKGLKGGEEVVSSGLFKLQGGTHVIVNNVVMPANEIKPNPADS